MDGLGQPLPHERDVVDLSTGVQDSTAAMDDTPDGDGSDCVDVDTEHSVRLLLLSMHEDE
jgi:hypothetical protein